MDKKGEGTKMPTYSPVIQRYSSKSIFIDSGSAFDLQTTGSIIQLSRVTDLTFNVSYPLTQTMYLSSATESYLTTPASVTANLKWWNTSAENEFLVGLGMFAPPSGTLTWGLPEEKNLYISVENTPGVDAIGATGMNESKTVLAFSRGVLNSYQLNAQVGGLIQSSASLSFLTSFVYSGSSGNQSPTVDSQYGTQFTGLFSLPAASAQYNATGLSDYVSAIAADDMVVIFPQNTPYGVLFSGQNSCYLQSVNLSLTFDRRELKQLGYVYPADRPILYPIRVDLTTNAILSQYQADQLSRFSCLSTGQSVYVVVKQPCSNLTLFGFYLDNLQIESQDFTTSIGRNDVVSIKYRGLFTNYVQPFFDSTFNYIINLDTSGAWGLNW